MIFREMAQTYQPLSDAIDIQYTTAQLPPLVDPDLNSPEENEEEGDREEVVQHTQPSQEHTSSGSLDRTSQLNVAESARQGATAIKRKRGRPKGSRTKKRRLNSSREREGEREDMPSPTFPSASRRKFTSTATRVPTPGHMTALDKQFHDFQWRVLSMCGEFYEAAGELVENAPPEVLKRCYNLDDPRNVNPISILNDAKKVCDYLLNNPSALSNASSVPASISKTGQATASTSSMAYPSSQTRQKPPSTPSSPNEPPYRPSSAAPTLQRSVRRSPTDNPSMPPVSRGIKASTLSPQSLPHLHINQQQGPWTDDESDRLRRLADNSRLAGGEIDWDRVVNHFGAGRTRHQILIKATSMGLKPSSTRPSRQAKQREHHAAAAAAAGVGIGSRSPGNSGVSPVPSTSTPSGSLHTPNPPNSQLHPTSLLPPLNTSSSLVSPQPLSAPTGVVWPSAPPLPYYRYPSTTQPQTTHQTQSIDLDDTAYLQWLQQQQHRSPGGSMNGGSQGGYGYQ